MADRRFEDFEIGREFQHAPGRTVLDADNTWFTLLTMNQHPLHFDAEYAAGTEFGRVVVNSCLTLSIVVGMSVADVSHEGGAFDIVRRALREALAAEEGWGAPTSLRRMLLRETGAGSVNEALHRFYDPDWPRDRIASLAPGVDRAAGKGDPAAVRVMRVSGEALGTLALQAVQALPAASENPAVHPCGGVFGSVAVRNAFAARVRSGGCSLADPVHDAATGALLRAYRTRGLEVTVGGPV